jgi:threonine/homoserine/homoserine lactone efflux protein
LTVASVDLLTAFVIATVSYAAVPGPGTVYIAAQAVIREPRAVLWGALGLHVGGYVIVFGSAAGLTVLFSAVPVIYEGLKLFGAAYLVWLGARMVFCRSRAKGTEREACSSKRPPATFSQGVLIEILNPTTVMFYVAFLPQFIAPTGDLPVWFQFLVLGVLVNLIFSLGDILTILIAMKVRARASSSGLWRRVSGWMGGGVLIGLGIRLATDRS